MKTTDSPGASNLAEDIAELRREAPAMYEALEARIAHKIQQVAHEMASDLKALPFQSCIQIMLAQGIEPHTRAMDLLIQLQLVFSKFEPKAHLVPDMGPPPVGIENLQDILNETLEPFDLVARVGPYQLLENTPLMEGRAAVGVQITAHPRTFGTPCWCEMNFTAFEKDPPSAWADLRERILRMRSV